MNLQPNLKFWTGMTLTAMLVMIGILAFDIAVPMPGYKSPAEAKRKADQLAGEQKFALEKEYVEKRQEIDARIWTQGSDAVGALALDRASNMARVHGLNLTAFRPQKPDEQGELTRLAYVMTLEGPYPGLQAMVRDLETPSNRLSVHMVQVASADEASDLVTATVGVSAFVEKNRTAQPAPKGLTP